MRTSRQRSARTTTPRHTASDIILTDSKYAKGCLAEDWDAKGANAPLVAGLRALLAASPVTWTSEWIPGHADVAGNDAADAAAVRGAKRSAASRGLTELDARIVNNHYFTLIAGILICIYFGLWPLSYNPPWGHYSISWATTDRIGLGRTFLRLCAFGLRRRKGGH